MVKGARRMVRGAGIRPGTAYTGRMAVNTRFLFLLFGVAVLAEGCHGGGSGAILPASVAAPQGGTASFSVSVPKSISGHPQTMQSMVVTLTQVNGGQAGVGVAPVTLNLLSTTAGCTSAAGGLLTCTATIAVPAGKDSFTVVTYPQPNGVGSPVSNTQANAVITAAGRSLCTQNASPAPQSVVSNSLVGSAK